MSSGSGKAPASEYAREKIGLGNAYVNDCIVDEIGWIHDASTMSRELKYFWEKTGCQPFVYLKAYDPGLAGEGNLSAREAFAAEYYEANFADRPDVLLYVYFCDEFDEGSGDDTIQMGSASSVLMDANAMDIFWNYLYDDWDRWDVNDNDGMFVDAFTRTADRIMQRTTTGNDVKKSACQAVIAVTAVACVVIVIKLKHQRDKEIAEETERILATPLETMADKAAEDLADKYSGSDGT